MNIKPTLRFLAVITLCCLFNGLRAQSCGSCTVNITGQDTLTYTVGAGQTFCIDSAGAFQGTITLSGGTICNRGSFNPKVLSITSGTLSNHGRITIKTDLALSLGIILFNYSKSITTIKGNLTISGGTWTNKGIANIKNNIIFNSGSFSNTAIVNCMALSGSSLSSIINSGIINKN